MIETTDSTIDIYTYIEHECKLSINGGEEGQGYLSYWLHTNIDCNSAVIEVTGNIYINDEGQSQ